MRALETDLRDLRQREATCLSRREILQDIEIRAEDIESGVKRLLRPDDEQTAEEVFKNEELPWQTIWKCSVDELARYEQMLVQQIKNDQRRHRRVRDLLKAAQAGCGDDGEMSVIDAINRAPVDAE